MPKIGIYALHSVRIAFITDIANMLAWKNNIKITHVTVCEIILGIRRVIHQALQSERAFVKLDVETYDLPWFTAYHRHHIDVFTCFGLGFLIDKPIQLIKLKRFGVKFSTNPYRSVRFFLSSYRHLLYSCQVFSQRRGR